ncbi:MAG: carboxymuconolactone decarboxylase family protein [Candidatus Velthaea sp.]
MQNSGHLTLPKLTAQDAEPGAAASLEEAQRKNGMVPNMYAAMANAPEMFDTYLHGYALFREKSGFTPVEQELVFLTVSRENACEYCMAAHSTIADGAKVPHDVTDAVREDRDIADPKLQALVAFVRTMFHTRGRPTQQDLADFLAAGYSERQVLDIILALAVKTISNYTNHLFDTEVDKPFARRAWSGPAQAVPSR